MAISSISFIFVVGLQFLLYIYILVCFMQLRKTMMQHGCVCVCVIMYYTFHSVVDFKFLGCVLNVNTFCYAYHFIFKCYVFHITCDLCSFQWMAVSNGVKP